jgi:RND family efflux transporter MFP subunit
VVRSGDVLALLQSDTVRAELAQTRALLAEAEASAQEARAQAERARSLQQQGFFSNAQLSAALAGEAMAQARVQSARAALNLGELRLSQTEVRSPDAGVISARSATLGAVVAPGMELFRLIRQGRLEWRAELTAADLPRVRVGRPAVLRSAAGCGCSRPRLTRRRATRWSMSISIGPGLGRPRPWCRACLPAVRSSWAAARR